MLNILIQIFQFYTCLTLLVTVTIFTLEFYNFQNLLTQNYLFITIWWKKQGWPTFSHCPKRAFQFSSVTQSCLTLCDPMNWSTPGLPGHHQPPESTQTMSIESMMPSNHLILCRPLLLLPSVFPSIRIFQMSQLFASGGQSIGVSALTSVLPMNTQDWSPLGWTGWISLQSKGLSRVFSNTTVQKH